MTAIGMSSLSGESLVAANLQTNLSTRETFPRAELRPMDVAGWQWGDMCDKRESVKQFKYP